MTPSITMRHRSVAVLFLCAVSMMGCFMWWGRLHVNTATTGVPKGRPTTTTTPTEIEIPPQRDDSTTKITSASTPPPYLFKSNEYSDDDATVLAEQDDDNVKQGESIRGISPNVNKKVNASKNNTKSAKSIEPASLTTASDSATITTTTGKDRPKMVWLMSYPNSGTSYTMTMVARASNRAIASNYGKEVTESDHPYSTPLYPGQWNGPFYKPNERKPLPRDYILVKTHCGGKQEHCIYFASVHISHCSSNSNTNLCSTLCQCPGRCVTCGPDKYVTNEAEFLSECTRGSGLIPQRKKHRRLELEDGDEESVDASGDLSGGFQIVHYDPKLVTKAIHLYRNPFHNIVSRFHLERKHWVDTRKTYQVERYTNDPKGFQKWCKDLNKEYGPTPTSKKLIFEKDIVDLMQEVPCHGEMYKYVQWHNMAHEVTHQQMKSTLVLHYENYEKKWNATTTRILDFLHLEMEGDKKQFHARHDYNPYFTFSQRQAVKALTKRIASEPVWKQLTRYFD